jgi:hypothetical protein
LLKGSFPVYYQSEDAFESEVHQCLKLLLCPNCKKAGCLILHGFLRGYEEASQEKFIRAHRVICNPRRRQTRKGCGQSFSIYKTGVMKYIRIGTVSLWRFLIGVAGGMSKIAAFRSVLPASFHHRSIHRWWRRFALFRQSGIRSLLSTVAAAPSVQSPDPAIATIRHLQAAFPCATCPIDDFHCTFQSSFL